LIFVLVEQIFDAEPEHDAAERSFGCGALEAVGIEAQIFCGLRTPISNGGGSLVEEIARGNL
jgi:hypothetical protein